MRGACLGLAFDMDQIDVLIEVSVETARMTHHHPMGYLGCLMASLFTRLGLEKIDPNSWMGIFINLRSSVENYLISKDRETKFNLANMDRFYEKCMIYAKKRELSLDTQIHAEAVFPKDYSDVSVRHKFYLSLEPHKWPGSNGCDSCIIAYVMSNKLYHINISE